MSAKYFVVRIQVVGGMDNWEFTYVSDCVPYRSFKTALHHGIEDLDHDDFWVVECVHSDGQSRLESNDGEREAVLQALGMTA